MPHVRDSKKESFWRRMVREQPSSGLTVRAWCHRHQVQAASFHWWRRELSRRDREKRPASFVPVSVTEDDRSDDRGRIEIVLAGERRVRLSGRVDRQVLADVVAVLEGQEC
jgi:hypothetical protein